MPNTLLSRLAGAKLATQGHFECPRGLGAPGPWQAHCCGPNGGFCIQITLARGTPRQSWEPQHAGFGALGPTLQLLAATKPSWHPLAPSKPTRSLTMYPEVSPTNSYSSSHTQLATCGAKHSKPQAWGQGSMCFVGSLPPNHHGALWHHMGLPLRDRGGGLGTAMPPATPPLVVPRPQR